MDRNKRGRGIVSEINITPFTDVVLVLLIIFMVITPLIFENNVKITLPSARTRETREQPVKIVVQVTEAGDYYVDSNKFSFTNRADMARFASLLASRRTPESTLIVRGDKNCKYDLIMQVVDLARTANFKRVLLAGEQGRKK